MRTHPSPSLPAACPEWAVKLAALHLDDLTTDERDDLQEHISTCSNCSAVYAQFQQVDASILSLPAVQPTARQISRLEALIAGMAADEPVSKPIANERKSQLRPGSLPAPRGRVGRRLSSLAAVLAVLLLAAGALALFSSRHTSSVGGVPGTLYTISYSDGTAYALDTETGQIKWRTPLHIKPSEGVLISHGMIFITSRDAFLYAIRESDGKLLWHRSYKAIALGDSSNPVIAPYLASDGKAVYFGAAKGIYAWSISDGHTLWYHPQPPACNPSANTPGCESYPILSSNGIVYVYFDSLYALHAPDGATIWHDQRFLPGAENNLVVVKNHLYAVSPQRNAIIVLQADTGRQLDVIPIAHDYTFQLLAAGEMVYAESGLHHVYAIRSSDNRILWQKNYADGGNLLTADDSNLYYVSTLPGPLLKGLPVSHTPGVISSLHSVVERLNAVSASNGSFRWSWQYPTGLLPYPATTSSGMLYVVANGIYALHTGNGELAWHALSGTSLARIAVG